MILRQGCSSFLGTFFLCFLTSHSLHVANGNNAGSETQPKHNPTKWCYWLTTRWSDLTTSQQLAAGALGLREEEWDNGLESGDEPNTWPTPNGEFIWWDLLNEEQKNAAGVFYFNEQRWDNAEHYTDCRFESPQPCLSGQSQLHVLGKGDTYLKHVEVGDKVLVSGSDDSGVDDYQIVYSFGHKDVYSEANFIQISTSGNAETPLEITGEHLLMKQTFDGRVPVRADSVSVGDFLIGSRGTSEVVTQISSVTRNGLYSPLTKDGFIVSNGLQVSSYTAMQHHNPEYFVIGNFELISHHWMSHAAVGPFRSMCLLLGSVTPLCEQRNEEGQLLYAAEGEKLLSWINEQASEVKVLSLTLLLVSVVSFHMMEKLFGCLIVVCFPLFGLLIHWSVKGRKCNK